MDTNTHIWFDAVALGDIYNCARQLDLGQNAIHKKRERMLSWIARPFAAPVFQYVENLLDDVLPSKERFIELSLTYQRAYATALEQAEIADPKRPVGTKKTLLKVIDETEGNRLYYYSLPKDFEYYTNSELFLEYHKNNIKVFEIDMQAYLDSFLKDDYARHVVLHNEA